MNQIPLDFFFTTFTTSQTFATSQTFTTCNFYNLQLLQLTTFTNLLSASPHPSEKLHDNKAQGFQTGRRALLNVIAQSSFSEGCGEADFKFSKFISYENMS